jgi:peroxiredoxin
LREIPLLKEFQSSHDDIQVVGIAVDRPDPVQTFSASMDFNYPILIGQNDAMSAAAALGVEVFALPVTVFTDAAGAVLGIHTGELHAEYLDNAAAVVADLSGGRIDRKTARNRIAGRM